MRFYASAALLLAFLPACSKFNSDKNDRSLGEVTLLSNSNVSMTLSRSELFNRLDFAEQRAAQTTSTQSDMNQYRVDAKGNKILRNLKAEDILSRHWSTKDPVADRVEGSSTDKAYAQLNLTSPVTPIIVAVVDSGVDINHEDLEGHIWTNQRERDGLPGVDDDNNGYIDDINGWNFLGNSAGVNVVHTTMELTREYNRVTQRISASPSLPPEEMIYANNIITLFLSKRSEAADKYQQTLILQQDIEVAFAILRKAGLSTETIEAISEFQTTDSLVLRTKRYLISMLERGRNRENIRNWIREESIALDYYYNPYYDSSRTVLDNPENLTERSYGNNDVLGDDGEHGTHVSGSIAALRGNAKGIDGQADALKIMAVRVVPDGDERDKDIANGIRYAVDNGARVINMSFGKSYSPNKSLVDAAMQYAAEHNVLVVHSAGNSSLDLDLPENKTFPARSAQSWLEIGASASLKNDTMVAGFSNYGHRAVDIFAPGYGIPSTVPHNQYSVMSGTSMASPQISGIAALIMSRYPNLTALKVKELILSSARAYPDLQVYRPISRESRQAGQVPALEFFRNLSSTGGVVDAFAALQGAAAESLR